MAWVFRRDAASGNGSSTRTQDPSAPERDPLVGNHSADGSTELPARDAVRNHVSVGDAGGSSGSSSSGKALLAACAMEFAGALCLAGCGPPDADYRVIEREYVPASERLGAA